MQGHRIAFRLASELGWTFQNYCREAWQLAARDFGHGLKLNGLRPAAWLAYFERSRAL
jgi:hypothetical protein